MCRASELERKPGIDVNLLPSSPISPMMLRVKLEAKLADEIELGFEEIDVVFPSSSASRTDRVLAVILDGVTMRLQPSVELAGRHLRGEIASPAPLLRFARCVTGQAPACWGNPRGKT